MTCKWLRAVCELFTNTFVDIHVQMFDMLKKSSRPANLYTNVCECLRKVKNCLRIPTSLIRLVANDYEMMIRNKDSCMWRGYYPRSIIVIRFYSSFMIHVHVTMFYFFTRVLLDMTICLPQVFIILLSCEYSYCFICMFMRRSVNLLISIANMIHISHSAYQLLKKFKTFNIKKRGSVSVKVS